MSSCERTFGINLRAGNFVVVWSLKGSNRPRRLQAASDGSFVVTSSEGGVGLVPLEGPPNGVFLQAGQSVLISRKGELSTPSDRRSTHHTASPSADSPSAKKKPHGLGLLWVRERAGPSAPWRLGRT